jgi:hypothetical protein
MHVVYRAAIQNKVDLAKVVPQPPLISPVKVATRHQLVSSSGCFRSSLRDWAVFRASFPTGPGTVSLTNYFFHPANKVLCCFATELPLPAISPKHFCQREAKLRLQLPPLHGKFTFIGQTPQSVSRPLAN